MKLAWIFARRMQQQHQQGFAAFIIKLSITATTVSVAAMILATAFVNGFQETVAHKIYSFWGHIRIQDYNAGNSLVAEEMPISTNDLKDIHWNNFKDVDHWQTFATKSAVVEYDQNIEGLLFKGVDSSYKFNHLQNFLLEGRWPDYAQADLYTKEIVLSKQTAALLNIKLNDTIRIYFIDNGIKSVGRKLKVVGLYKTGIEEYDKLFGIGDIRLIQRLNNWEADKIGGVEIFLKNPGVANFVNQQLYNQLPNKIISRTTAEVFPNLFDWLKIQDTNKQVMYTIMTVVALINLISCLLILVLERTKMIGILKALGSTNYTLQQIFVFNAIYIAVKGIVYGCIIGIGFCYLQQHFGIIQLDETAYYVKQAPVSIHWNEVAFILIATVTICFIALWIPSFFIQKINPVKAIHFK